VYPNPFNPTATVVLALPQTADMQVRVINLLGRQVLALPTTSYPAGYPRLTIDLRGRPSGMYFLIVDGPNGLRFRHKMLLMK
jgi:hypothetical protein